MIDIQDFVESYNRRKKADVLMSFMQADVLMNRLSCMLDTKSELMMPWDCCPSVFRDEKRKYKEDKAQRELENFKTVRRNVMDAYNAKRCKREVNTGERTVT